MGWVLECLDSERHIQLVVQNDLSFQCIALNLYVYVHISNSSLRSNLLGYKYVSTVCSTLLLCSITIFVVLGSIIVLELCRMGKIKKVN